MTFILDENECWQAVQNRGASLSVSFFYAVRSTKIYCRPSCPSRRPRRNKVEFFAALEDAETAGYRACLRCRPREASAQAEAVADACRYLEAHSGESVTLAALAERAGFSSAHFQRVFRRSVGVSPREYAAERRLGQFKQSLQDGEAVGSALIDAGYGSTSRLYENPALGMTPTAYKRGGECVPISYTVTATLLGQMLVAATAKGICAITLGDRKEELEAALRREYPAADFTEDDSRLAGWVQALVRHLAGEQPGLDLPLDIRATAFQRRVWLELQRIPYGETRSYTQVAETIGSPNAARAVAQACASNPAALAVPCHRVVRGTGGMSGYRWGVERKSALLAGEKLVTNKPVTNKPITKETEDAD